MAPIRTIARRKGKASSSSKVEKEQSGERFCRVLLRRRRFPLRSASSFGVSELAQDIGRDCYVDLNGWHLFLKDMKPQGSVHTGLANVVTATILKNGKTCSEQDATEILKAVKVPLGGGKIEASLFDLMPKRCVDDFVEIAKKYADDM